MSYLQSAERLTVVVLKARNLKPLDESKNASKYFEIELRFAEFPFSQANRDVDSQTNLHPNVFGEKTGMWTAEQMCIQMYFGKVKLHLDVHLSVKMGILQNSTTSLGFCAV